MSSKSTPPRASQGKQTEAPGESGSRVSTPDKENTVKYYRVQTKGEHGSFEGMIVNDDGTVSVVTKKSNLNVSAETSEHAEYFLQKKGEGSYIIEFEVDNWFHDMIMENAIPQKYYKKNPLNQGRAAPKIVDPHQPGLSLELHLSGSIGSKNSLKMLKYLSRGVFSFESRTKFS
ncbi:hypothetical protein [Paenibacillus tyrfis]|uniref:hypothetical protein n=1 Tax=Paenibacillus tyrfis TaxID=1501230 RepID=UPI002165929F|nr:hypothetical protein [Paenibacillus tyrfis]